MDEWLLEDCHQRWSYLYPAPGWVLVLSPSGPGVSTSTISTQPRGEYWSYLPPPRPRGEHWSYLYPAPGWVLVLSPPAPGWVLVLSPPGPGVSTGSISTRGEYWSYLPPGPGMSTGPIPNPAPRWQLVLSPPCPWVSTGPISSRPRGEYWSYLYSGWVLVLYPTRPRGEN